MRRRPRSEAELEQLIGIQRNDRIGVRVGRVYTRTEIEKVEAEKAPWLSLRRIRKWAEPDQRSS